MAAQRGRSPIRNIFTLRHFQLFLVTGTFFWAHPTGPEPENSEFRWKKQGGNIMKNKLPNDVSRESHLGNPGLYKFMGLVDAFKLVSTFFLDDPPRGKPRCI
jgi:hypothetical protein